VIGTTRKNDFWGQAFILDWAEAATLHSPVELGIALSERRLNLFGL